MGRTLTTVARWVDGGVDKVPPRRKRPDRRDL